LAEYAQAAFGEVKHPMIPIRRLSARLTIPTDPIGATRRQVLEHSARTAVTAVASVLAARVLKLPQTYWAPITTW